jgi:hypothetical protein
MCGQEQNGSDRCDEDHGDRPSWTADDAFLAECEAKANEAIVVANDADYGPWGVILLPEGADEFDQDAIVMSDNISITDKYKHGEMKPCNAKFTAHARTSNPDLAARVIALVKMVRERDEKIGELSATAGCLSLPWSTP